MELVENSTWVDLSLIEKLHLSCVTLQTNQSVSTAHIVLRRTKRRKQFCNENHC